MSFFGIPIRNGIGIGLRSYVGLESKAPAWTPYLIPTALWLDANDTSTITLNGSTVSQWNDKSGNGRNAVQANATSQPLYSATAINGKPALTFDGVDDIMKTATALGISGANPRTFAYVFFRNGVAKANLQIGSEALLTSFGRDLNVDLLYQWGADLAMASPGIGTNNIELIESTGAVSTGYQNGTQIAQGAFDLNTTNSKLLIGGRNGPEFPTSVFYADITYGEIIVTRSVLSSVDRARLEGYLAWKWGLEANLPADHPYKLLPPTV